MSDLDDSSFPWPRAGDDPFGEEDARDWWHAAVLNYAGKRADFIAYASGYKLAGDVLVSHVEATGSDQDFLVYPILFSYRQYIELRLKYLIRYGRRLLDRRGDFPPHHRIRDLWTECASLLIEIEPESAQAVKDAGDALRRLAEIDPESYAFRYPMDRSGRRALPADLKRINLRHVRDVVGRIAGFLDAAVDQVTEDLDLKREIEAEYGP